MSATPSSLVRGDEILVDDLIGLGGSIYTVLSNNKERGEGFITMQVRHINAVTKVYSYAEITVSIDSMFFVTRQ